MAIPDIRNAQIVVVMEELRLEKVIEYSNTEITRIINEYIHNERNRRLLLRRYVDGITLECLAEEFDLSVRQVKNIIYGNDKDIFPDRNGR